MSRRWTDAWVVVLMGAAVACTPSEANHQKSAGAAPAAAQRNEPTAARALRLVVAPQGNEARYRVREQLLGLDFPNDAVGVTSGITGTIAFDDQGNLLPADSKIVVDVTRLASDKERRDGYVQRRLLATEQHPTVVLVPHAVKGVKLPWPKSGVVKFELTGDLTVRGVTRPTTWRGEATFDDGRITGQAATVFQFEDFGIEKPRVRSVLSVDDDIKLEYDFTVVAN